MATGPSAGGSVLRRIVSVLAPFLGLALVVLIFLAIPPHELPKVGDLRTVAVHTAIVGICAAGMTMIIISGGIDLSVGSMVALASVAAAYAMGWWNSPLAACGLAMLVGLGCGMYNGLLVTALRLPPFIATLGTLGFFRGLAKWWAKISTVTPEVPRETIESVERLVQPNPEPRWLLVAPGVWLMLGVCVLMALVLRFTVLGRHTFAIGSNIEAARRCGIKIGRTRCAVFAIGGLLVGLGGFVQFARLTIGDPTVAVGLELDIIAAVVIGGASLSGGHGSIAGTLAGAAMMAYLKNRCAALAWPNYVQEIIVGHIIIAAVAIDQWRVRRGRGGGG